MGVTPLYGQIPFKVHLLNGSSKAMNVNGSVTPVVFSYTATEDQVITSIKFILEDSGTNSLNTFGAIASLTNGCIIEAVIDGNTEDMTVSAMKDNADLMGLCTDCRFQNVPVISVLGGTLTATGFTNSEKTFAGEWTLDHGLAMKDGDIIRLTVRDNLTGLNTFETTIEGTLWP